MTETWLVLLTESERIGDMVSIINGQRELEYIMLGCVSSPVYAFRMALCQFRSD